MTLLIGCVDNNLAPGLRVALVARFFAWHSMRFSVCLGHAPDQLP
jgi:hypothetical protein